MNMNKFWMTLVLVTPGLIPAANGTIIATLTDQLSAGSPTQLGRLSRNNIPSDWSVAKAFPGVVNPGVTYNYLTYSVSVGLGNYLQIDVDWGANVNAFASIYQTSYNPLSLSTNYLGDIGLSGNLLGNPGFFQVISAVNSTVVVVINSVSSAGLGIPYNIIVESYVDSSFTDPPAVPEPASFSLALAGLGVVGAAVWRRRKAG